MNNTARKECQACGASKLDLFFELTNVPIYCNVLWANRESAQSCEKGDIRLAYCSKCGLIYNLAFDQAKMDYAQDYENSLHFSPRFQKYSDSLVNDLIHRYNLRNKDIIEIGCGKGDFLVSLCERGDNRGIGFDRSYIPRKDHQVSYQQINFIMDYYSEKYADYPADFICCRHVLEHIPEPLVFLETLAQTIGERRNTTVFFEVPNAIHTLRNLAVWDIIYEHCCYFTPLSLNNIFKKAGFTIYNTYDSFEGQFLCVEAARNHSQLIERDIASFINLGQDIAKFTEIFNHKIRNLQDVFSDIFDRGLRCIIWGAGSKGVTFLNLLNIRDVVEYVVDINPRKQGKFIPGTGQRIVSPSFLTDYQPDSVVIMNPIYEAEICKQLSSMNIYPNFINV